MKVESEARCTTYFERRTPGKRYVNRRWRCPRKKLRGYDKCSYCLPPHWRKSPSAREAR